MFACNRDTIFGFEQEWVKATGASLNTFSPVNENVSERENKVEWRKKNKETKRYYCELCNVAFMQNGDLKRHLDTLKHSHARLNSVD